MTWFGPAHTATPHRKQPERPALA